MSFPWYTQRKRASSPHPLPNPSVDAHPRTSPSAADGTIRFALMSQHADPAVGWTDSSVDLGVFTAAVLDKPLSLTSGKTYPVMAHAATADLVSEIERATGDKTVWEPLSKDELHAMMDGKPFGEVLEAAATDMFECVSPSLSLAPASPSTSLTNFSLDLSRSSIDTTPAAHTSYGMFSRADDPSCELGVRATSFDEWVKRSGWTP